MKKAVFLLMVLMLTVGCRSVHVSADFDNKVDFTAYKTYNLMTAEIAKVAISDLDKRRITSAIEESLQSKGFTKSDNPDVLVNIFTKERKEVNVNNWNAGWGWGWGWGWGGPWGWNNYSVTTDTYGTLYIDVVDTRKQELVWQGQGDGLLDLNPKRKEAKIRDFVTEILAQYPPKPKK